MYQILMTDLDPKFMAHFSTLAYSSSEELTRDVGLLDLIPGCVLDSKIFEPCGYSLNAIIKVYFVIDIDLKVIFIVLMWAEVCYITVIRLVTATFSPVSGSHTQTVWLIYTKTVLHFVSNKKVTIIIMQKADQDKN